MITLIAVAVLIVFYSFYRLVLATPERLAFKTVDKVLSTYNAIMAELTETNQEYALYMTLIKLRPLREDVPLSTKYEIQEVCHTFEGTCYLYVYLKYASTNSLQRTFAALFRLIDEELYRRGIQPCTENEKLDLYCFFKMECFYRYPTKDIQSNRNPS